MVRIMDWDTANPEEKQLVMQRSKLDVSKAFSAAQAAIQLVREKGNVALIELAGKYDGIQLTKDSLRVSEKEFSDAYQTAGEETVRLIRKQVGLSRKFAVAEKDFTKMEWETQLTPGVVAGVKWTPLDSVGLYVPGGNAPYPTVMQILAVPAKIAGVNRVIAFVPPKNCTAEVLVAARESGVDEVYRIGGAAAIAAMAFGTNTIKPVEKIVGPGSPIVVAAKAIASNFGIAIDMPAGPSELLIIDDSSLKIGETEATLIAADMISANEHGADSSSVFATCSKQTAIMVARALEQLIEENDRKEHIVESLSRYSAIVVMESPSQCLEFANDYAPEHLEIFSKTPREVLKNICNAGSVFIGKGGCWNFKALGDYAIGVNHILPTAGGAKAYSPVGVWTYLKAVQFSEVGREGFLQLCDVLEGISTCERFYGHRLCGRLRRQAAEGKTEVGC